MTVRMQTNVPTRKAGAAAIGAALANVLVFVIELVEPGITIPDGVAISIETLFVFVMTLAAGYFVPPAERDQIVSRPNGPQASGQEA